MTPRRRRPAAAIVPVLLLGSALLPFSALAQMFGGAVRGAGAVTDATLPPASAPGPEEAAPETAAIPVAELSQRARETRDRLREIESGLAPDGSVSVIGDRLGGALEGIRRDARDFDLRASGRIPAREMLDLQQRWLRSKDLLEGWQDTLMRRLRGLEVDLDDLRRFEDLWSATLARAPSEAVPPATLALIRDTLETVRATGTRVRARRGELLVMQDRIFEGFTRVTQVVDRIDRMQAAARRDLLAIDSPPLWAAFGAAMRPGSSVAADMAASWERARSDVAEFRAEFAERRYLHIGIALGFLGLLVILRRRMPKPGSVPGDLVPAFRLLGRPFSAAFIVALLLTPLLYPRAPIAVQSLIGIAALVPVLRLVPLVLPPRSLGPLLTLALFVLLMLCAGLLLETSVLYRVALLITDLAGCLGMLWMLRTRVVTAGIERSAWRDFTRLMARIAVVLLGAGVLANLVGNVSLAIAMTRGVISSAYFAVVLFAANRVLDGVVRVSLTSAPLLLLRSVRAYAAMLQRRITATLRLAAFTVWALLTLSSFEILPAVVAASKVAWSAHVTFGEVGVSLGDILAFVLVLGAASLVSRLVQFVLEEELVARLALPRGLPTALTSATRYGILFLGFLLALAAAGVELSRFTILAGAFGVGVGFGLQAVVNNFVSGLILLFERPVRPGDWVQIGPTMGEVTRIGGRSSTVRTFDGAEVIVPNSHLISNEVINWTLSDPRVRVEIKVGVAYGSDPAKVLDLLRAAAATPPGVLTVPSPVALFTGFGESSLDFVLRVWTDSFTNQQQVRSDVAIAIHQALARAGIGIPFPQRDLHVRAVDPAAARLLLDRPGSAPRADVPGG